MGGDKRLEIGIDLWIGNFPGKPPENHTQEDDGETPDISLPRIITLLVEDFRGEVWITADDAGSRRWRLAGIVKDGRSTKVNQLHDVIGCHDAIIELEIAMSETHLVQVFNTITNLAEYTVYLGPAHLASHDNREKIKRCIFHDLTADVSTAGTDTYRAQPTS